MRVFPVPALHDNYAYVITTGGAAGAAVVDPSEAPPVIDALLAHGVGLAQIWLTHHHPDHTGGVVELLERFPDATVFASPYDRTAGRLPAPCIGLEDGAKFVFGGVDVSALHVPGHTFGAIAFLAGQDVFVGDTLFIAGCGRVFEGTMAQMHASLMRLAGLPANTRVWCGHEYTVRNLEFAETVDPGNTAVRNALVAARATRARGEPTVPSTIAAENAHNPFLRCANPPFARGEEPARALERLRREKDAF